MLYHMQSLSAPYREKKDFERRKKIDIMTMSVGRRMEGKFERVHTSSRVEQNHMCGWSSIRRWIQWANFRWEKKYSNEIEHALNMRHLVLQLSVFISSFLQEPVDEYSNILHCVSTILSCINSFLFIRGPFCSSIVQTFMCSHRPATWAGCRAGPPVSVCVSSCDSPCLKSSADHMEKTLKIIPILEADG